MSIVKKNFPRQEPVDPRASATAVQYLTCGWTNLGVPGNWHAPTIRDFGLRKRPLGTRAVRLRLQFENSHRQYHSRVCSRDEPSKGRGWRRRAGRDYDAL